MERWGEMSGTRLLVCPSSSVLTGAEEISFHAVSFLPAKFNLFLATTWTRRRRMKAREENAIACAAGDATLFPILPPSRLLLFPSY